jgi:hypothetical protein
MTSTDDKFLQAHMGAARITLETVVGLGKSFAPMIMVVRGGETVAHIIPPSGDGQMIHRIAHLAADGYLADEIIIVTDTYSARELFNPYTFKPWQRGELEDLAVNHNGVERGWVRDALMLLFVRRVGKPSMYTLPYRPVSGVVTWLDDERTSDDSYLAAGLLTTVMEPTGMFKPGEVRPGDEVFTRFLERLGASVLTGE